MSFEVSYAVLAGIQSTLGDARGAVESAAGWAPGSVDAGELTPVVLALMSTITDSAAGLREKLSGAASLVGEHLADVRDTDSGVASSLTAPVRSRAVGAVRSTTGTATPARHLSARWAERAPRPTT